MSYTEYDGYDGDENCWRIAPSISSVGEHGFTLFTRMARRLNYYGAYSDQNWSAVTFNTDRQKIVEAMQFMREHADINRLKVDPNGR